MAQFGFLCVYVYNLQVAVLHGEMSKVARANVLNDFKRGRVRALIVSDVVARGLDVPECDAGEMASRLSTIRYLSTDDCRICEEACTLTSVLC